MAHFSMEKLLAAQIHDGQLALVHLMARCPRIWASAWGQAWIPGPPSSWHPWPSGPGSSWWSSHGSSCGDWWPSWCHCSPSWPAWSAYPAWSSWWQAWQKAWQSRCWESRWVLDSKLGKLKWLIMEKIFQSHWGWKSAKKKLMELTS